ncbi:hypothetical protein PI124_g7817 [Phytophthora idaei]|nr:hypothetical protein PI124_g7817 [Phytophthora idaei]
MRVTPVITSGFTRRLSSSLSASVVGRLPRGLSCADATSHLHGGPRNQGTVLPVPVPDIETRRRLALTRVLDFVAEEHPCGVNALLMYCTPRPESETPNRPESPASGTPLTSTSPHGMDNKAPVSITSSSASGPPATSNPGALACCSAATPPSRRNLDVEFEVADSSCSEYVVSDSEESEHHDAIDVATDADNKEDLPDIYADPNIVLVSENPDDYTRLDSDDDNDGASVYSEDDDLGSAEAAAEDASISPDLHFDSYTLSYRV